MVRQRRGRRGGFLAGSALITLVIAACGARTGLDATEKSAPPEEDAGPDVHDAGPDVHDAAPDVLDAPDDEPPPTCDDAGVTYIYVVSQQNTLYSFYPPTGMFMPIGTISCPAAPGQTPFSMAVDRGGTAYVVFTDGNLFKVSTATAKCEATSFVPGQSGFTTFGMGFSSNTADQGETLFVAQSPDSPGGSSMGLASIDTKTFDLTFIGPFTPALGRTELTGTGDSRLFGYSIDEPGPGAHLSAIDKATGNLVSQTKLAVGDPSDAFAYAFWGEAFYIFTAPAGNATTVTRYVPMNGSLTVVASNPDTIVGAGVSTCAPH